MDSCRALGRGTSGQRLLAAVSSRDNIIQRQSLLLQVVSKIFTQSTAPSVCATVINEIRNIIPCENVSIYVVDKNDAVSKESSFADRNDRRLPLHTGIVGCVAATGKTLNLADAYSEPEWFDPREDLPAGYKTTSICCIPIEDKEGKAVGCVEAVNKCAVIAGTTQHVPFDNEDEEILFFIMALTWERLQSFEILRRKEVAAVNMTKQIQASWPNSSFEAALSALAKSICGGVGCKDAFILLLEKNKLRCRASTNLVCKASLMASRLSFALDEPVVGLVATSKSTVIVNTNSSEKRLDSLMERFLPGWHCQCRWASAMCSPILDERSDVLGVVLVINEDGAGRCSSLDALPTLAPEGRPQRPHISSRLRPLAKEVDSKANTGRYMFGDAHKHRLELFLSHAAYSVKTNALYHKEMRLLQQLEGVYSLNANLANRLEHPDVHEMKEHRSLATTKFILKGLCDILACQRCALLLVDHLGQQFIGHRLVHDELMIFRSPLQGLAGLVALSSEVINIQDASTDPRFNKEVDEIMGNKVLSVLYAPIIDRGKVLIVVEAINKMSNDYFTEIEEEVVQTFSTCLHQSLKEMVSEYRLDFIQGNDAVPSDVKDIYMHFTRADSNWRKGKLPQAQVGFPLTISSGCGINFDIRVFKLLTAWDFNYVLSYSDGNYPLPGYIAPAMEYFGCLEGFSVTSNALKTFVGRISRLYSDSVPYHNWLHAFTVFHATFLLIDSAFTGMLQPCDILALLLAALGHDVEHPGHNNAFIIRSQGALAMRYNDIAVLENHHASVTSIALLSESPGILDHVGKETQARMRKLLVSSILATESTQHQHIVQWFDGTNLESPGAAKEQRFLDWDVAVELCNAILHSADLAHPAMCWKVHKFMSQRCAEEFLQQFREEKRLGLPTLPFMGKNPTDLCGLGSTQVGFIQLVAMPLWKAFNKAVGSNKLGVQTRNMETNRTVWQRLADANEEEEALVL